MQQKHIRYGFFYASMQDICDLFIRRRVVFCQEFIQDPFNFLFPEVAHVLGKKSDLVENIYWLFLSGGIVCAAAATVPGRILCGIVYFFRMDNSVFHILPPLCRAAVSVFFMHSVYMKSTCLTRSAG